MADTPRNAKCPCGSGKKYKRCCVVKSSTSPYLDVHSFKPSFDDTGKKNCKALLKYDSKKILRIFSLLQLHPQNHGKNIRLEIAVSELVNNIHSVQGEMNFEKLKADILEDCPRNLQEDPPEEFFTENVVFSNGNNIVYPGIANNGTEIVQGLINATIQNNELPEEFNRAVMPGILFILHVHNKIAQELGHTHRIFEDPHDDELFIPEDIVNEEKLNLFKFSFNDIKEICDTYTIPYSTIDQFVFVWQKEKIQFTDPDNNPLFRKPFVFIEEDFILAMPTAQLLCLNEFIINTAIKFECLKKVLKAYEESVADELYPLLGRMKWRPIKLDFSQIRNYTKSFLLKESLWQFDEDKLAYVTVITEKPNIIQKGNADITSFSNEYSKRINAVANKLKQQNPSFQILLVNFSNKCRVLGFLGLALKRSKDIVHQIHFTPMILDALVHNWKFDRLTIWKYAKYLDLSEDRIRFMPLNTHLSKFDWYKKNDESFFHPDNAPFNLAVFEFDIEGDVRRKGLTKLDKIGIPFYMDGMQGYLQCIRKEEYYPVYLSQEFVYGTIRNCLLKYSCPIWITSTKRADFKADVYISAILYWLNEMYPLSRDFINRLGAPPISILLSLDEEFYNMDDLETIERTKAFFKYKVDPSNRHISFTLPIQIVHYFSTADNRGEHYLMKFVLDALGDLMEKIGVGKRLDETIRDEVVSKTIPLGNKKMITIVSGERDLKISDVDTGDGRKIPKADISYLLETQVSLLKCEKPIPRKIGSKSEKVELLNRLVKLHFDKVVEKISQYDTIPFLLFLMRRHESLIQKRAFRKLNYPVRQACYAQYFNVFEEFSKTEAELNEANLSMRVLIEFTACMMPTGDKAPNDDDVDMLLAHCIELVNYGAISDGINYDIENPEIGLLPSGRIGMNKDFEENTLKVFKQNMYNEEFDSYHESFKEFFRKRSDFKQVGVQDHYTIKFNKIFKEEWGIALFDIFVVCYIIASYLFKEKKSLDIISVDKFYSLITEDSRITNEEINAFCEQMSFIKRENILKAPLGFKSWEIYPWRYNRRLSYLMKPLIPVTIDEKKHFVLSARHLLMAGENLLSLFYDGTLKVDSTKKKILQLLAERNRIKGAEYRNEVADWLVMNTSLDVHEHEAKISPNGLLKAESDKGDIDIIAIDRSNKIIYSIECKNTSQSKMAYDYKSEIDTYLGVDGKEGLIQKHINRHRWLTENCEIVLKTLRLAEKHQIISVVISKNILPMKHLRFIEVPIVSFYEVRSNRVSFDVAASNYISRTEVQSF
jgi:hypothetical protein